MMTSVDIMSENLLTINETDFLKSAYKKMHENGIRHLPVINESGKIVGIISERDLKLAMSKHTDAIDETFYQFNSEEFVSDYMSRNLKLVLETESLMNVAKKMLVEKISSILVVDKLNKISGIITTDDLLAYLISTLESNESRPHVAILHLLKS